MAYMENSAVIKEAENLLMEIDHLDKTGKTTVLFIALCLQCKRGKMPKEIFLLMLNNEGPDFYDDCGD